MTEHRPTQRDIQVELKGLRLSGMAMAWADLVEQGGNAELHASRWLIEHLLQAEAVNRHMRSIAHQTKAARFPVHRDLAGFDFEQSKVERALIQELATLDFTAQAHNVVFIGGTGTGKSHLATALGVSGGWNPNVNITSHHRSRPEWREDIAAFVPGPGGLACVMGRSASAGPPLGHEGRVHRWIS